MKGGVIEVIGTGRGDSAQCLEQAEVCGIRLRWSWVCRVSATELSLAAARQTVCVCRKSETLEAFQALEEGRVDRLDGKTPVPPSKGRVVRRQSSPNLPREVRLGCAVGPHPNFPSWVAFPCHIFLYFCRVLLSSIPLLPLPSIPSPTPALVWDSWLLNSSSPFTLWVQELLFSTGWLCAQGCNCCLGNYLTKLSPSPNPILFSLTSIYSFFKRTFCSLSPTSLGSAALLEPRAAQQRPQGALAFLQPGSAPREGQQEPGGSPATCQPQLVVGERQPEPTLCKPSPPVGEENRGARESSLALGEKLEEPRRTWPPPKFREGPSRLAGRGYRASPGEEEPRGHPASCGPQEGLG